MKCPKITLCNLCQQRKGSYHQGFGLLVVKYGCESWTIKKTEHWGTDGFELWCCRRLLQVPWTVKRSNQSILKEINPEYSLEGLMLKLKSPDVNFWIIGKDPDAGKDWRQKEKRVIEDEMVRWHHQLNGLGKLWEMVKNKNAGCATVHGVTMSQTQLSDWTTKITYILESKK